MNTVSKTTVVCILAMLVMVISSGRYSMVQVNAQSTQTQGVIRGHIEEVPLMSLAPGCLNLKANMANDTADHWHANMFKTLDCADVLARTNNGQGFK
ncbi:MAG: hypothetical protein WA364_17870 [Candidatus Nitrosopolaris sp.]